MNPLQIHRRLARVAVAVVGLPAALSLAACNADQATGTGPALRPAVAVADPTLAPVLTRTQPLAHDLTASVTVDAKGGVLRLPEAGLLVVIPRNALPGTAPVTITVTAVAGSAVAYEFEPHGIVFDRPLLASQELGATSWSGNSGRQTLEAAYFASPEDLDVAAGTTRPSEFFATDLVATGNRLRWDIPHFSGYVIVTGRKCP